MKEKLSITIDRETVGKIEQAIAQGRFRNKSHVMEYAVIKLLNEILEEAKQKNGR